MYYFTISWIIDKFLWTTSAISKFLSVLIFNKRFSKYFEVTMDKYWEEAHYTCISTCFPQPYNTYSEILLFKDSFCHRNWKYWISRFITKDKWPIEHRIRAKQLNGGIILFSKFIIIHNEHKADRGIHSVSFTGPGPRKLRKRLPRSKRRDEIASSRQNHPERCGYSAFYSVDGDEYLKSSL